MSRRNQQGIGGRTWPQTRLDLSQIGHDQKNRRGLAESLPLINSTFHGSDAEAEFLLSSSPRGDEHVLPWPLHRGERASCPAPITQTRLAARPRQGRQRPARHRPGSESRVALWRHAAQDRAARVDDQRAHRCGGSQGGSMDPGLGRLQRTGYCNIWPWRQGCLGT